MLSAFDNMFDLNRNGQMEAWERAVQYQFLEEMSEEEDSDEDDEEDE